MKTLFLSLVLILICNVVNSQWYVLNPSPTSNNLRSVHFINENTGWIGGSGGTILKIVDGGESWLAQSISSPYTVYDIKFVSNNVGFLCTGDGKIFKTVDAGNNWVVKFSGSGYGFFGMHFRDSNNGWVVGGPSFGSPKIRKTSDGGETWISLSTTGLNQLRTVHFFSGSRGIVSGADGKIMKTTNGGTNWYRVYTSPTGTIFKFFYVNSNVAYASSTISTVLKTTSGDTLWTPSIIPGLSSYTSVNSLHFISATEGWVVCEGGYIAYTNNGGSNWVLQNSGTSNDLDDVCFVNNTLGFAVGNGGVFLSTVPIIGIKKLTQVVDGFRLHQNYPNPFNPLTMIGFSIPTSELTTLKIYNAEGKEVATLVNEKLPIGSYKVDWNANNISSGMYFYRLQAGEFVETKKMLFIK